MTLTALETPKASTVAHARNRAAVLVALVVSFMGFGSVAAFADTVPSPPADPSIAVGALASGLNNGVISTLTTNIPYIVGLLVMFTVIAAVRRHTGAKKG